MRKHSAGLASENLAKVSSLNVPTNSLRINCLIFLNLTFLACKMKVIISVVSFSNHAGSNEMKFFFLLGMIKMMWGICFVLLLPHGILGFGKCPLIEEIKYTNI